MSHHHKLVTAQARHQITGRQRLAQPMGDLNQQHVAVAMPHRVVHFLEAIQVDQHDHQLLVFRDEIDQFAQVIVEVGSVGKSRQGVMRGHVVQPVLDLLAVGDVGQPA